MPRNIAEILYGNKKEILLRFITMWKIEYTRKAPKYPTLGFNLTPKNLSNWEITVWKAAPQTKPEIKESEK